MGSGLALATAVLHPERVRSVTTVMGAPPGKLNILRYVKFGVFPRFARIKNPETDEGAVATLVEMIRLLSSPNHFDEDWARSVAELSHRRSPRDPSTTQRQTAAGLNLGTVAGRLGEINVPTLVVNGADDPLIRPSAGAALARADLGSTVDRLPGHGAFASRPRVDRIGRQLAAQAGLDAGRRPRLTPNEYRPQAPRRTPPTSSVACRR